MSTTCPYCSSTISDDNPAAILDKIEREMDWSDFESDHDRWGYPVGKKFSVEGVSEIEVVSKKMNADNRDSWGELPQGSTFEVWVVLKVGDTFLKKTGEGDSYSNINWCGMLRAVQPREVTKVIYEF